MKEVLTLLTFLTLAVSAPQARALLCDGQYAAIEQAIGPALEKRLTAAKARKPLVVNSLGPAVPLYSAQNSYYFVGDIHGSWPIYAATMEALSTIRPTYFALEVPEGPEQTAIWERFNDAWFGHPSFAEPAQAAWQVLESRDRNYDPRTCPFLNTAYASWCQSPMLALVTRAKELGARIVPIDSRDCHRLAAPVGHRSVLARNYIWAKNIFGLSGKIMVFGGRQHYSSPFQDNVQDYVSLLRFKAGKAAAGIAFIDPLSPAELAVENEVVEKYYFDSK